MASAYEIAHAQIGLNEHEKSAALQEFLANGGQNLDPAVTAWCAAFVNATLEQAGMESTGRLNARSYLDWGEAVDQPQRGDVAVFSRGDPNGPYGHVGFFDGYNEDGSIRVLGGNQSDAVNVQSYGADRLLGFRRAPGAGVPAAPGMPQNQLAAPVQQEEPQNQLFQYSFRAQDPRQFATTYRNVLGA